MGIFCVLVLYIRYITLCSNSLRYVKQFDNFWVQLTYMSKVFSHNILAKPYLCKIVESVTSSWNFLQHPLLTSLVSYPETSKPCLQTSTRGLLPCTQILVDLVPTGRSLVQVLPSVLAPCISWLSYVLGDSKLISNLTEGNGFMFVI